MPTNSCFLHLYSLFAELFSLCLSFLTLPFNCQFVLSIFNAFQRVCATKCWGWWARIRQSKSKILQRQPAKETRNHLAALKDTVFWRTLFAELYCATAHYEHKQTGVKVLHCNRAHCIRSAWQKLPARMVCNMYALHLTFATHWNAIPSVEWIRFEHGR